MLILIATLGDYNIITYAITAYAISCRRITADIATFTLAILALSHIASHEADYFLHFFSATLDHPGWDILIYHLTFTIIYLYEAAFFSPFYFFFSFTSLSVLLHRLIWRYHHLSAAAPPFCRQQPPQTLSRLRHIWYAIPDTISLIHWLTPATLH